MISPVTEKVINEQSGVLLSGEAHIKGENLHIILEYLRNKCYTDKPRAVLREYGTNAQDIHNRHSLTTPIQVSLPSELDCFLKVRDFGPALDDEKVRDIFLSYGESDKRNTNGETGSLGLGCKCGFAYGDSFLVNAYRGGKLSIWNAYIDPSKKGKIDQMAVVDTTEPDGLEIVIPVNQVDIREFRSKALQVYSYFEICPNIVNLTPDEAEKLEALRNRTATFSGNGWKYIGGSVQSIAVMANVGYTLSVEAFTTQELPNELRNLAKAGVILNFKNGELEYPISREELEYTATTKQNIVKRLQEMADEITAQAEAKFKGCATLWDAKLLWQEVFRMDGAMYAVRELFDKKVKFNGKPLNSAKFDRGASGEVEITSYYRGGRKIEREHTLAIEANKRHMVVVNDTDISHGIVNRVVKPICDGTYTRVYVVKFSKPTSEAAWRAESGFDIPMVSLATLPKTPISAYFGSYSTGGTFSPKHTSREFSYTENTNLSGWSRHKLNRSDYWEVEDVDLEKDAGVYVELQKFEYKKRDGYFSNSRYLKEILALVRSAGITVPKIYGFKTSSANKAAKNPLMVNLWDWLDKAIADVWKANPKLEQDYANRNYIQNELNAMQRDLNVLGGAIAKWTSLPANSNLITFFQKVNELHKYDSNLLTALERLQQYTTFRPQGQVKAKYDLKQDHKNLESRYPLLFKTSKSLGAAYIAAQDWSKACEDYVLMVDTLTP